MSDHQASKTRCVVLMPPAAPADGSLVAALGLRGWEAVETVDDPYLAMTEVCLLARTERSRAEWGLTGSDTMALVVVPDPDLRALAQTRQLFAAVRHHLPQVGIWLFRHGQLEQVAAAAAPAASAPAPGDVPGPMPAPAPAVRPTSTPDLRLAPVDETVTTTDSVTDGASSEADRRRAEPQEITEEEMNMLFGPDRGASES